jgi:hypothetical protein
MKPVNAKIPAKTKAGIVATLAVPKLFASDTRRKTRQHSSPKTCGIGVLHHACLLKDMPISFNSDSPY